MNKKNDILLSTGSLDYDCISLNETWLHPSHKNEEFIDKKYNIFRKDRKFTDIEANRGGGVLVAIHKKYDCELIDIPETKSIEAICVRVKLSSSSFLYIHSLYVQNRINTEPECTEIRYKKHIKAIEAIKNLCTPNDFMAALGDFNMPSIKWLNDESADNACEDYGFIPVLGESNSTEVNIYRETSTALLELGLHQMCDLKNQAGNELDLIYTNFPELTSVGKADLTLFPDNYRDPAHNPIVCTIECEPMKFNSAAVDAAKYCFQKITKALIENWIVLKQRNFSATWIQTK